MQDLDIAVQENLRHAAALQEIEEELRLRSQAQAPALLSPRQAVVLRFVVAAIEDPSVLRRDEVLSLLAPALRAEGLNVDAIRLLLQRRRIDLDERDLPPGVADAYRAVFGG